MPASTARKAWPWVRAAAGLAVLAALVRAVGVHAFATGVRALDPGSIAAALVITAATTACCAWRWRIIVHAVGGELPVGAAIGAYYRSQFLDATLPGGVLGDVYRGVRRGVHVGKLGRGLRTVFWDRALGQAAQLALAALVLAALPSPVQHAMPAVGAGLAVVLAAVIALTRSPRHPRDAGRVGGWLQRTVADLRRIRAPAWTGIAVASALAIAGYVAIFMLAARAVGVTLPPLRLLPLLLLTLVAAAIPFNIAGFGPREGAAAWAFGAAGASAQQGVAAATLYGVLGLIAVAPGAWLLLRDWARSAATGE